MILVDCPCFAYSQTFELAFAHSLVYAWLDLYRYDCYFYILRCLLVYSNCITKLVLILNLYCFFCVAAPFSDSFLAYFTFGMTAKIRLATKKVLKVSKLKLIFQEAQLLCFCSKIDLD